MKSAPGRRGPDMNRNQNEQWLERACPSYQGDEPYIFLSFAPFDLKEGLAVLSILNGLGCRVRYDEKMLTGRPWTSGICDAIEGCSVLFTVNAPDYHFCLTKKLADEYAGLLEKRDVILWLHDSIPDRQSKYPTLIYSSLADPSLQERCRQGLEAAGYFSAVPGDPSEVKYDLMLDYYETVKDWERAFGGLLPQSLNLRTHESHGYMGHYLRSDEDVYSAVHYGKKERFYLRRRSSMEDYKPGKADERFLESIRRLNGNDLEELERKYVPASDIPKPWGPFPAGYPYKDEFEYLSSDEE